MLFRSHAIHNSIVLDFNGKESIYPPIPRNYYHALINEKGDTIHYKEPNVWILGSELDLGISNDTYNNRTKGGFGIKSFLKMASKNMIKNRDQISMKDIKTILYGIFQEGHYFINKKCGLKAYTSVFNNIDLESIGKFLNMSPIRVKAEHDDYLRLKDVDAVHDYVFVRRLIEEHIDDVLPENVAKAVKGFKDYFDESRFGKLLGISDFSELMNEKIARIQFLFNKNNFNYILPNLFHNGEFIAEPRSDENLEKAVERSKRDLERYHERSLRTISS